MFSLTLNDVLNVVRALLDIGLVWAVIFFGLRIVRNNSRTVQIFKGISKALYKADKLIYTVTLMSEKERDTKLGDVAVRLERVRNCLLPYRFKAKAEEDLSGVYTAIGEMEKGVAVLDKILERDKEMRSRRAKQEAGWKKD